ncbi:hypothetical protein [Streptomyces sp. NPDC053048]|uniref:hypothetical protein n=1 Tax=Streptomyces sp. NPDC053048 TaxID=3365694 RepID=UPI0037CDF3C6
MSQHSQHKQRNWFARHKVLTGAGALVAVIAIGGALSGGGDSGEDSGKSTAADRAAGGEATSGKGGGKEGDKAGKGGVSGNGTHQVGSDIKPGTYRSVGNKSGCYWERAKDSKGDIDSILANDNVEGQSYVTIKAEDRIFKSRGCKSWEPVTDDRSGTPKSTVAGSGMYRVGVDIAPGTYKSTGNKADGCYWERDKDALHDATESILANENVAGSGVVTIAAEDAYFKTSGCADWKKTG